MDWQRLVDEHGKRVHRAAWRILGDSTEVDDVLQDVFLQAYELSRRETVRSWPGLLVRLATCRALERLRRRRTVLAEAVLEHAPATTPGPLERAVERELMDRLRAALAQLPPREADVFCLHHLEGLDLTEIARTLGVGYAAAASALHRARQRLAPLFQPTPAGGER